MGQRSNLSITGSSVLVFVFANPLTRLFVKIMMSGMMALILNELVKYVGNMLTRMFFLILIKLYGSILNAHTMDSFALGRIGLHAEQALNQVVVEGPSHVKAKYLNAFGHMRFVNSAYAQAMVGLC
jgi:hypothetical protein